VLERAGYTLAEIREVLASGDYPEAMVALKRELDRLESLGAVAERVLARYGYDGTDADVVIEVVQDAFDATTMTRGDLIRFIERGIEEGATHEVSAPAGSDAVTVQTIHAAKGLEYPIVVLANMNRHRFPPSGGGGPVITFDDPIGLRQRDLYAEAHGHPHVYDNWRADVLQKCLPTEYDEERRLLYVAMTRAQDHLVFTAGAQPNTFLEALPVDATELAPDVREGGARETVQTTFAPTVSPPAGPIGIRASDLVDDEPIGTSGDGRGPEFGTRVHRFADAYAQDFDVAPADDGEPDWANVMAFLDALPGELMTEYPVVLPLRVDGQRVAVSGDVDLVHVVGDDRVEVVDFKTDLDRSTAVEYAKQVSVYYHVVDAAFPEREVDVRHLFTYHGAEPEAVDPLSIAELERLVGEHPRIRSV
jgi:ATP-dependent exoDNAse (exonuclease V) beta subunit